jgi:hypothetical protein
MTAAEARVWAIICELSDDEGRRELAAAWLSMRPWQADTEAGGRLIEAIRAAWSDPIAGPVLRGMIRRSGGEPERFSGELAKVRTRPPGRRGPKDNRRDDYLADNVARAYRWLTGKQPPAGNVRQRPELESDGYYRLGAAVFALHGIPWSLRGRLQRAASRKSSRNTLPNTGID